MAIDYWNGYGSTSSTSTTSDPYCWQDNYTSTSTYYTSYVVRKILVETPEHWTSDDIDVFVRLINIETSTGWKIEMVISGDVVITDPNIEVRSMKNFVPLLLSQASYNDSRRINEFFKDHTVEPEND